MRIEYSHYEESKHPAYLSLEHDGQPAEKAALRAETCPSCQGCLKQFYLEFDRHADVLADDLAGLVLDMRPTEDGYLRHSPNLLLALGGEQPKTLRAYADASMTSVSVTLPCE